MMEQTNFGKGLIYGGVLSLGLWAILFETIYVLI